MSELIENQTCPAVGYQAATVCVPVSVEPFAKAGITKTKCCGNAVIVPGRQTCSGVKNGVCSFTLAQNVCVAVPVDFGANAVVGEAYVDCLGVSSEDICSDCSFDKEPIPEVVEDPVVADDTPIA